jgi:hypothetical protein
MGFIPYINFNAYKADKEKTTMKKANEINFPTNGNCKKVKDLTTGKEYGSITETAIVIEVTAQAVSNAIKNKTLCKGHRFILVKDLHDNIEVLCEESAKANARADKAIVRATKAEAKLSEMEAEMAEFRKWKAYQEAKRRAEEKARKEEEARLERERKEEEKRQKLIEKAQANVDRWEKKLRSHNALGKDLEQKLMKAEMELEALMDKEVL